MRYKFVSTYFTYFIGSNGVLIAQVRLGSVLYRIYTHEAYLYYSAYDEYSFKICSAEFHSSHRVSSYLRTEIQNQIPSSVTDVRHEPLLLSNVLGLFIRTTRKPIKVTCMKQQTFWYETLCLLTHASCSRYLVTNCTGRLSYTTELFVYDSFNGRTELDSL